MVRFGLFLERYLNFGVFFFGGVMRGTEGLGRAFQSKETFINIIHFPDTG